MGFFDFLKKKELLQIKELQEQIALLSKYQNVVDTDKLIESKLAELSDEEDKHKEIIVELLQKIEDLRSQYSSSKDIYDKLSHQVSILNETLNLAELGIYEPIFNFDTPEKYKQEILKLKDYQKQIFLRELNEYQHKSTKAICKYIHRGFNIECDNIINSVSWNNIEVKANKIETAFNAANRALKLHNWILTDINKSLKIKELCLVYEYKRKRQEEKEEQSAIRAQMREEEKAAREFEAARLKAEKEEANYHKALDKARAEIASLEGDKQQKMQAKIDELELRLKEAEENKERALSMAQQTKRGHVYVISNMGSFGEDVYKIGMTRRLDPFDRVNELGDASVPFKFDVHAMIFSENAPALETKLHKFFDAKRLNLVNNRREFFNVTLDEIEKVVTEENGSIEFTKIAQASEYRESKAIRDKMTNTNIQTQSDFPDTI